MRQSVHDLDCATPYRVAYNNRGRMNSVFAPNPMACIRHWLSDPDDAACAAFATYKAAKAFVRVLDPEDTGDVGVWRSWRHTDAESVRHAVLTAIFSPVETYIYYRHDVV